MMLKWMCFNTYFISASQFNADLEQSVDYYCFLYKKFCPKSRVISA